MVKFLLAVTLFVSMLSPVFAETPDVMTIVKQMKEVMEPARPSLRTLVFTNIDQKGGKIEWQAVQARKKLPNGKRILTVVQEPPEMRGIAQLMRESDTQQTPILIYLPFIKRVREIVGLKAYDSYCGSEFTYADLAFIPVHEGYKLLGEEQHAGVRAYKIEETVPQERRYYSRIITWVTADTFLPLERNYYDVAGRLWKTELFKDVAVVNGVPTPMNVLMTDVQQGYKTELRVTQVNYDVTIPDEFFDPNQLPKAADLPLWRMLLPQGTRPK
jgi:hypothetical protein